MKKTTTASAEARRPTISRDPDGSMSHRKLIRPSIQDVKDVKERPLDRSPRRKAAPPDATNAEAFYYLKQMNSRTPMVVRLTDGEEIRGVIEWYDKECIKLTRNKAPNLLVPKHNIKYMYKESEARGRKDV